MGLIAISELRVRKPADRIIRAQIVETDPMKRPLDAIAQDGEDGTAPIRD